jgi:hypothetical protein
MTNFTVRRDADGTLAFGPIAAAPDARLPRYLSGVKADIDQPLLPNRD